ncbi:MAG: hypothetical protein FJ265_09180 [Planctomycetes bacterium]|nr:hypothetical protein [Planctomycetota bacterium]
MFIVLNLALAAGFLVTSGTYLQRQANWKERFENKEKEAAEKEKLWNADRLKLENDRNGFENAKTAAEVAKGSLETANQRLEDQNKLLQQQLASMEGDIKSVNTALASANDQAKAAFAQSQDAYKMAIADQKTKDDAVRAKDGAEAENRTLKTTIASLEETVKGKDTTLADLQKELNEKDLLVSIATANGFIPALAAPPLKGTVTDVRGDRLCTIVITDNPGNVDIGEFVRKNKFKIAIWDASGYKGDAVVTEYHPAENAMTCNLIVVAKGPIKKGDSAGTSNL